MKTNLLLILLVGFAGFSYAQTIPNKQQAVNELRSYFYNNDPERESHSSYKSFLRPNKEGVYTTYKNFIASMDPNNDCILHFDYKEGYYDGYKPEDNYSYKDKRMSIDMSRVSEIIPVLVKDAHSSDLNGIKDPNNYQWNYEYNLYFVFVIVDENSNVIGKTNLILHDVEFPFSHGEPDMENEVMKHKNSHVYKVFNHLRKLCDAPDPLSWD